MTASPTVRTATAIADPGNPKNVIRPNPDGSLNTGGVGYETVTASQTAQVLGPTGAVGDYLHGLLVIPATTAAGAISVLDGSTSITVFAGAAVTALADLRPFFIEIGAKSTTGPWKVTTGANVSAIGLGAFT